MEKFLQSLFSVYPLFELQSYSGFTIDSGQHPEGYITDFRFSAINSTTGNAVGNIEIMIGNLPKAATVVFDLEKISMAASSDPRFTIKAKHGRLIHEYYTTFVSVVNQTAYIHSSETLTLKYHYKTVANPEEYVRLKYRGMCSLSKLNANQKQLLQLLLPFLLSLCLKPSSLNNSFGFPKRAKKASHRHSRTRLSWHKVLVPMLAPAFSEKLLWGQ